MPSWWYRNYGIEYGVPEKDPAAIHEHLVKAKKS